MNALERHRQLTRRVLIALAWVHVAVIALVAFLVTGPWLWLGGTALELFDENLTTWPPAAAGVLRVTVPREELPPTAMSPPVLPCQKLAPYPVQRKSGLSR